MNGYITVKLIADDLNDHPLLRDISYDRIINYIVELIRITGAPLLFLEKTALIDIDEYRGQLPCDFVEIIQIRGGNGEEYLYSMNNFHTSLAKEGFIGTKTYKILDNVIFTSMENGMVEISYKAIPLDENGFPMISDNAEFIRAIEAYIKLKRFTILLDTGKINQAAFQNAQQEYAWAIGQAQTGFIRPSDDEMQTLSNVICTLIPRVLEHASGFAYAHNRQYIRQH